MHAGPFWCAQSDVAIAVSSCMKEPEGILVPYLVGITRTTALSGTIDLPDHMRHSRVFLFSGKLDTVVVQGDT